MVNRLYNGHSAASGRDAAPTYLTKRSLYNQCDTRLQPSAASMHFLDLPAEVICSCFFRAGSVLRGRSVCRHLRQLLYACGTENEPIVFRLPADERRPLPTYSAIASFISRFRHHVLLIRTRSEAMCMTLLPIRCVRLLDETDVDVANANSSPSALTALIDDLAQTKSKLPAENVLQNLVRCVLDRANDTDSDYDDAGAVPMQSVILLASRLLDSQHHGVAISLVRQMYLAPHMADMSKLLRVIAHTVHTCKPEHDLEDIQFLLEFGGFDPLDVRVSVVAPLLADAAMDPRSTSIRALRILHEICGCYAAMVDVPSVAVRLIRTGTRTQQELAMDLSQTLLHAVAEADEEDMDDQTNIMDICQHFVKEGFLIEITVILRKYSARAGGLSSRALWALRTALRSFRHLIKVLLDSPMPESYFQQVEAVTREIAGFKRKIFRFESNLHFLLDIVSGFSSTRVDVIDAIARGMVEARVAEKLVARWHASRTELTAAHLVVFAFDATTALALVRAGGIPVLLEIFGRFATAAQDVFVVLSGLGCFASVREGSLGPHAMGVDNVLRHFVDDPRLSLMAKVALDRMRVRWITEA